MASPFQKGRLQKGRLQKGRFQKGRLRQAVIDGDLKQVISLLDLCKCERHVGDIERKTDEKVFQIAGRLARSSPCHAEILDLIWSTYRRVNISSDSMVLRVDLDFIFREACKRNNLGLVKQVYGYFCEKGDIDGLQQRLIHPKRNWSGFHPQITDYIASTVLGYEHWDLRTGSADFENTVHIFCLQEPYAKAEKVRKKRRRRSETDTAATKRSKSTPSSDSFRKEEEDKLNPRMAVATSKTPFRKIDSETTLASRIKISDSDDESTHPYSRKLAAIAKTQIASDDDEDDEDKKPAARTQTDRYSSDTSDNDSRNQKVCKQEPGVPIRVEPDEPNAIAAVAKAEPDQIASHAEAGAGPSDHIIATVAQVDEDTPDHVVSIAQAGAEPPLAQHEHHVDHVDQPVVAAVVAAVAPLPPSKRPIAILLDLEEQCGLEHTGKLYERLDRIEELLLGSCATNASFTERIENLRKNWL